MSKENEIEKDPIYELFKEFADYYNKGDLERVLETLAELMKEVSIEANSVIQEKGYDASIAFVSMALGAMSAHDLFRIVGNNVDRVCLSYAVFHFLKGFLEVLPLKLYEALGILRLLEFELKELVETSRSLQRLKKMFEEFKESPPSLNQM